VTTGCHDLSDQFSAQLHQLSRRTHFDLVIGKVPFVF